MTRVLLVEDDPMIMDIVGRHVQWAGYELLTASDGRTALDLAQENLPDVILMDMGLPIMDGWQATKQLKSDPRTGGIPVIALTAFALDEEYQQCIAAGCDEYEVKPVEFPRLFAKINRLLNRENTMSL